MRIYISIIGVILLAGCGMWEPQEYPEQPPPEVNVIVDGEEQPGPAPREPGQATSYAEIQTILDRRCAGCHGSDPFMQNEVALRDPQFRVFEMVDRDAMPPSGGLSGQEKSVFLNFF